MPALTGFPNYNQLFIDLAEHYDEFLMNRARKHPVFWMDRIPKGVLSNYEGLVRKANIFHGGLGEQAGLSNWRQVQVSRRPSSGNPGHDACSIPTPKTFSYAIEPVQYTLYEAYWQSLPICLNDIRFLHEGREQCRLITSFMGYITQSVWENWNREQYILQAVRSGHAFILTEGGLDYDSQALRFQYDPFTVDSDGDTVIRIPVNVKVSTLNWSFFDWWQDYLGDQCPEAAPANDSGLPIFGLVVHRRDFDRMVMGDSALREDMRYAKASILFDDYRKFDRFRGWAIIHDQRQARFKFKRIETIGPDTYAVFKRVLPMRLGRVSADIFGQGIPEANPEYMEAELAIGVVFMRDVFQNLIPTQITNLPTGMVFGPAPGFNGEFRWVNEYDPVTNPFRENGFFIARFQTAPKPLMFSSDAIAFLYRRCPQTWNTQCEINTMEGVAGPTESVALEANPTAADVDNTNRTLRLRLAKRLPIGIGAPVTISPAGTSPTNYVLVSDADAPVYVFATTSTATINPADYVAGTTTVTPA